VQLSLEGLFHVRLSMRVPTAAESDYYLRHFRPSVSLRRTSVKCYTGDFFVVNKAKFVHNLFLVYFLYMFRATMCPSSGEKTVFMRHLVLVILCGWLSGMQGEAKWSFTSLHPHRIASTKCRINTVFSPDDGHIVARNM